jgi:hypothetical protein
VGSSQLLPFFYCFNVFAVETVHRQFHHHFFLVSSFFCFLLPRFPAMSSAEGSFDPLDPDGGEEFVKKLEIPQGLLLAPSVFLSDGALALGSQSAALV